MGSASNDARISLRVESRSNRFERHPGVAQDACQQASAALQSSGDARDFENIDSEVGGRHEAEEDIDTIAIMGVPHD